MPQAFLDTPQKWICLGAACVIGFLMRGTSRVFGLLFVASLSRYGASRKLTSIPFILPFAVMNIIGPLVGYMSGKFGLRAVIVLGCVLISACLTASYFAEDIVFVIIFVGVGFGFGFGFAINLIPQALTYRFQHHVDKANGLYQGASAIGGFVLLAATNYLLENYGVSGTFLILGGTALHGVPAAMLLKKPQHAIHSSKAVVATNDVGRGKTTDPSLLNKSNLKYIQVHEDTQQIKEKQDAGSYEKEKQSHLEETKEAESHEEEKFLPSSAGGQGPKKPPPSTLFRVFLDPVFIFMNVTQSISLFVFVALWTVVVDASVDKGVSREQGFQIMLGSAIADTLGRSFLGYFTDAGYISRINFATLCSTFLGGALLLFTWCQGYIMIMIIMCLSGYFLGGLMMIGIGILSVFVEKQNVRMATASRYFSYAPMSICQPYIIGYYRDTLKSYDGLFYIMSFVCFVGAAMYFVTPVLYRRRNRWKQQNLPIPLNNGV